MKNEERGFRQIGNLTNKIVNSLGVTDMTPTSSDQSSATTGSGLAEKPAVNSIGRRRGGINAVTTRNTPPSVYKTDQALEVSLPEPLRTWLRSMANYDADHHVISYAPIEPKTDAGLEMMAEARNMISEFLLPAPKAVILKALAKLRLSCISRAQHDDDSKLQRAVYVDDLQEFPADVVKEACTRLGRTEDWFPPLHKVRDECQHLVRWRRATAKALGCP